MTDKLKKNAYLGSIWTEKYVFEGVFRKSFYEDDIQPEIQVPPGLFSHGMQCMQMQMHGHAVKGKKKE